MISDVFRSMRVLSAIVFLAMLSPPWASTETRDGGVLQFKNAFDKILTNPCLKNNNFGIEVYSLDKRETLYARKPNRLFIPASNLKLLTTAATLNTLGPNYRFPTQIYTSGKIQDGVLKGDLYIKGFGDPKFVTEQMWLLAIELKNLPLKMVEGDLIADDSYFDGERRVAAWHKKGNTRAYDAPLGALSFNFNTVTAFVSPGEKVGAPGQIILEPDTKYTRLKNRLATVSKKTRSRVILDRLDRGTHDEISLSGVIAENTARKKYYVNITDPPKYSATVFKQYLERAGVSVSGKVGTGTVPKEARILWTHESEPLSLTLNGLLKFSNNFVAEQILKALAAKRFGPPGTTENGLRILDEYMEDLGFDPGQFKIADSSGLSRKSRLSPYQIVRVLEQVRLDLSIYPEFISALGAMGVDGNVRKRMPGIENANRVRAKTGTLDFISALSGYFQTQDGEVFAFSFLMNDLKCSTTKALKIQDQLVREGLRFQRTLSRP